ncbi:BirA family transcriptional regulator, biotin operon repressor/biotin-[acetyl-CoA-carboxylase] ligase [Lebetimonas natsushimae]|uniref:BirA family transcriptional regulator, biotin operon repressor/biotin-[acetyl-CoA-carboxylase] ligase n=1 Tax=Lebetimonas natsushimae TaxID=1936991 RepID=A0A292YCR2_9BACT|nr:biotin--[acetyl-CoA-carboxylase] ligase [Lebetimonas natsushimae]GAX87807.1 BirA family transcriptional regulator, biotin operon repressor/biotin-[acetyl-CoA-carboxylase] ligase [Lebetimonas natsushimae]
MKSEKLKIKNEIWNIIYFDEISSTQKYLLNNLNKFNLPVCVWSEFQTDGIGSRGNKWLGERGNLFFSFAIKNNFDVPLQSFSIFFAYIMKKNLEKYNIKLLMKWPNDLYTKNLKKVCGVLTNLKKNVLVVGIGLNTKKSPLKNFDGLDLKIKNDKILKSFLENVYKYSWKDIIEEYKKEFDKTKSLFDIYGDLQNDGSLKIKNEKVYSKR